MLGLPALLFLRQLAKSGIFWLPPGVWGHLHKLQGKEEIQEGVDKGRT